MSDEDLFAADVAIARDEAAELLKLVAALMDKVGEGPEEQRTDELLLASRILDKALDYHNAVQKIDTWRGFIKDKQVNESALMEALAEHQ